jgi:hypothetical protein
VWKPDGAILAYVDNRSSPVAPTTNGLVLHVQAGNGLLTGWFDNPESRASSTWQALKKGDLYQFGDPDRDRMWAQADGNYSWASVETEGYPNEPLNAAQIDAVARIYAAGHLSEGWPFRLAEKPTDRGLGWHGMGGTAWGGHTGCPGDIRKAQRADILARAQQLITPGGFLMALTDKQQTDLVAGVEFIKDRLSGIFPQNYLVVDNNGVAQSVPEGTPGSRPARGLDELAGNYIVRLILAGKVDVNALAAATAAKVSANASAADIAAELLKQIAAPKES